MYIHNCPQRPEQMRGHAEAAHLVQQLANLLCARLVVLRATVCHDHRAQVRGDKVLLLLTARILPDAMVIERERLVRVVHRPLDHVVGHIEAAIVVRAVFKVNDHQGGPIVDRRIAAENLRAVA